MASYPDSVADLVDHDRYPITDLSSSAGQELVGRCRSDLEATGACRLPNFIDATAIRTLAAEAAALAPLAYHQDDVHNVYFEDVDPVLPQDHPNRLLQHSASAAVGWDEIPQESRIRQLYESDDVLNFIGAALGKDPLYRNADPIGACTVVVYKEGDELGWHFDNAEFAVTLMLQTAEGGGEFEYVPNIRSAEDENYPGLRRLLEGSGEDVIHFPSEPGTLAFFRGQYSIHRVTPIVGDRLRMNVVFAYAVEPGKKLTEYTQKLFYGRTA
jgi:hypothetical protein